MIKHMKIGRKLRGFGDGRGEWMRAKEVGNWRQRESAEHVCGLSN